MHPLPSLIAVYAFIIMGIGYFVIITRLILREGSLWGSPSISPFLFYSGKITMFLCWGLTLAKAIVPSFGWVEAPQWMSWTGSILLCFGTAVLLLSFYALGFSLRYGLPEEDTKLKTTGLYRFSRHPLYLGVFITSFACIVFFPDIPNILAGLYCIAMQWLMIGGEEKFLAERFGDEWTEYTKRVRRLL